MANTQTGANIGFEEKRWLRADKLRDTLSPKLLSEGLKYQ
jgi:hypothetical protein